jgi:tetraacyldisaccharide 4'-kinase
MSSSSWLSKICSKLRRKIYLSVQKGRFSRANVLRPMSGLWSIGAWIKNRLYDRQVLPIHRLPVPVISVGNIVAGGSGKTPLVLFLAELLQSIGLVAIISRGYKAQSSSLLLGDELTMLSRRLTGAICIANPDRVAAGFQAIAKGARLILLDDGFQHRRLHRDLDFVVIDSANPFGYGAFLPRGLLRDSPRRLSEADALFVNGDLSETLAAAILRYSSAPLIHVRMRLCRILDRQGNERTNISGQKVGLFCAIGRPERFIQTVRETGAEIVQTSFLLDHEKFDDCRIKMFADECRRLGAMALVCTEKDAVKLSQNHFLLPIYYFEMRMEIVSGQTDMQNLIEKIHLENGQ